MVKRAKGTSGEPIGCKHSNLLFDNREYVIEFTDGTTENYFANVIAECTNAQVDSEGNQYQLLSKITDHRSDNSAIQIADRFTSSPNGNHVPKPTTQGWSLLVSWRDGSSDWLPLKDLKDAYPVQIAEYAAAKKSQMSRHSTGGYIPYYESEIALLRRSSAIGERPTNQAILANDPQIWHTCAENCRRGSSNRR